MLLYPSSGNTEQQVRSRKSSVKFCVLKEFQTRHQLPSKMNFAPSSSTEIFNFIMSIVAIKLITEFKSSKGRDPPRKRHMIAL